jgi:hypothetical protein
VLRKSATAELAALPAKPPEFRGQSGRRFRAGRGYDQRESYFQRPPVVCQRRARAASAALDFGRRRFFLPVSGAYLHDPALAYGFARTADLRRHLEQQSGRDLSDYFSRWYAGEGYPSYTVVWSQNAANEVSISLNQITSVPTSVAFFPLPVPVQFVGAGGKDTIIVLDNIYPGQHFTVQPGFKAALLKVDPDLWLISSGNLVTKVSGTDEALSPLNAWSVSPNPATTELSLRLDARLSAPLQVSLYSPDGKRLREWPFQMIAGANLFRLELPGLPSGVYQLALEGAGWRDGRAVVVKR